MVPVELLPYLLADLKAIAPRGREGAAEETSPTQNFREAFGMLIV